MSAARTLPLIVPRHHEPRYTSPAEEARLRRIVGWCVDESGAAEGDQRRTLIDQYTYLLRTVLNSMLRDRRNTYV